MNFDGYLKNFEPSKNGPKLHEKIDLKIPKCQKIIKTTASWGSINSAWSTEYAKTGFTRFWAICEKADIFGKEKHTIS